MGFISHLFWSTSKTSITHFDNLSLSIALEYISTFKLIENCCCMRMIYYSCYPSDITISLKYPFVFFIPIFHFEILKSREFYKLKSVVLYHPYNILNFFIFLERYFYWSMFHKNENFLCDEKFYYNKNIIIF